MKKPGLFLLCSIFLVLSPVFGVRVATLPGLLKPEMIEVWDGKIYVVDGPAVKMFSLLDYRFIGEFGKKGAGPGELFVNQDYHIHLQILKGFVYLNSKNKIIKYSLSGEMVEEKTFRLLTWQIIPFGADYTVVKFGTTPGGDRSLSALIVGPDSRIRRASSGCISTKGGEVASERRMNSQCRAARLTCLAEPSIQ